MRAIIFAAATLLAPMLAYGIVFRAGPGWALWPSAVFMAGLLVSSRTKRRSLSIFVPFGMLLGAVLSVALVTPMATPWLLWPVMVTTLAVVFMGIDELAKENSPTLPR